MRFHWFRGSQATVMLLLVAQAFVTGCDDQGGSAPVVRGPTEPTRSPAALAGEPVRGTASDSAFRPLAGARVEILDGPQAGMSTTSDARGDFGFMATVDDTTRFRASKEGHVTATATIQPACDRCNPSRWVHINLDVLDPPVNLAGHYTLTLAADSACATLPDELRTRTYDATVQLASLRQPGYANSKTAFEVIPSGSTFADTLGYISLNVAGNFVSVWLGDHTDPGIAERVAPNTYFAFGGGATLTVASPVHAITTPFEGWIDYCALKAPVGARYDCNAEIAVTFARCNSSRHQLTLTRR